MQIASTDEARPYFEKGIQQVEYVSIGSGGLAVQEAQKIVERVTKEPDFLKGMMQIVSSMSDSWPIQYDGFLAAITEHRPDLMVIDFATTAALDAAEAANVPFIVNNADLLPVLPSGLFPPANNVPSLFAGKSKRDFTLIDRYLAPVSRLISDFAVSMTIGRAQNKCRQSRGLPPVNFHKRLLNTLILVDTAFGIEYERPLPPSIQLVGPLLDPNEPQLTEAEKDWLTDGLPVVFVNMGTVSQLSREHVEKLALGFASTDFRVLWVIRSPAREYIPNNIAPNIRLISWVSSQLRVLAHPNVKAFVSHCGTNSVQESIAGGTPIVGFPMFAAQRDMGFRITDAGIGLHLDKTHFTLRELQDAIKQVLNDNHFRAAIHPIQKRFAEAGGVRRAADLIEMYAEPITT
ncbi:hypothetical protein GCM10028805_21320 [Spirosoma harenae]